MSCATANANLMAARQVKNDEFYTLLQDIQAELLHGEYAPQFRGKIVYLNCDKPGQSMFWEFFASVFSQWGLRRLMATYYEPDGGSMLHLMDADEAGCVGTVVMACDGDFRSSTCQALLRSADIVVTNPPFSLFREYLGLLMSLDKKFLIIGSMNAITYRDVFPLLQNNWVWPGYTHPKKFLQPDRSLKSFGNIMWFTNLDILKRHAPLDLQGRYYGREWRYPMYANYDAIECSRLEDIPGDYHGKIGVPITFLDRYCPNQFEIVGISRSLGRPMSSLAPKGSYEPGGVRFYLRMEDYLLMTGRPELVRPGLQYRRMYDRIVIRRV